MLDDDNKCHACNGTGGNDYPVYCLTCDGRGYIGSPASVEQDEHDDEHDDERDDERDDGECGACHGSGGGDYPMHCSFCSGRGYVGRPRVRDYDDFDRCDRWEGYDDRNAEVNW